MAFWLSIYHQSKSVRSKHFMDTNSIVNVALSVPNLKLSHSIFLNLYESKEYNESKVFVNLIEWANYHRK